MEIGQFKVTIPKIQEWNSTPYSNSNSSAPLPETPSTDNFYTNGNGSQVVFYLTPGNHDRMWADIDLFSKCESSSQWQQFLSRAYVQFGQYRALRVFTTTGPDIFQAQYFFEVDTTTLLAAVCTFGNDESVSETMFDDLFSGFHIE